jgi:uncharacterized membrane protein
VQRDDPTAENQPGSDADAGLERFVFFSDAVIAIALTLLALDLKLPTGSTDKELWDSFFDQMGDSYFAFALSFVVITMMWSSHHRLFRDVVRFDPMLVPVNMSFLFLIVVLPFATRLIAEDGDYEVGTVVYAATVALTCLSLVALTTLIQRRGLADARTPDEAYTSKVNGLLVTSVIFAVSIPITFIAGPGPAKWSWLVLSLLTRPLETRLTRRHLRPTRSP